MLGIDWLKDCTIRYDIGMLWALLDMDGSDIRER